MPDNSSPLIENLLFVFDWQMSLGTSQALSLSRRSWTGWRWVVKRIYNVLRDPVIRLPMGLRPTIRVLSLLSIVISYFILNLLKLSFYLLLIVLVIAFGSLADWRSLWGVSASALFGRWEIRVVLVTLLKSNLLTVTVANSPWRWSTNGMRLSNRCDRFRVPSAGPPGWSIMSIVGRHKSVFVVVTLINWILSGTVSVHWFYF
jgi:hypothetical protein